MWERKLGLLHVPPSTLACCESLCATTWSPGRSFHRQQGSVEPNSVAGTGWLWVYSHEQQAWSFLSWLTICGGGQICARQLQVLRSFGWGTWHVDEGVSGKP